MTDRPMSNSKPSERHQTDQSLRSERNKADQEYDASRAAIEEQSDQVREVAQARADGVLKKARDKADAKLDGSTGAIRTLREEEDRALKEERRAESDLLEEEREARSRALAELLRLERGITDQDLLRERSGADAALVTRDGFLGMVSHDLRALLGAIALNAQMLQREVADDTDLGARVNKRAESILRCSAGMKRLLGDLLDLVSIEAGQLGVQPGPGELGTVVRDVLEAFELSASAAGVSLSASKPTEELWANFDHERLVQVGANLVGNALKFTPPGGTVRLSAGVDGDQVRLSVSDTGPGIPADQLETIFSPFQQVNRLDRRGLGLGLHIARTLVTAHGGRIWAESTLGQGSTFHLTLPRIPRP